MNKPPKIPIIIGTSLGVGYWPWGPGTAGALLGVVIWIVMSQYLSSCALVLATLGCIIAFTVMGTWATWKLKPFWGDDPKKVVIDETVGVLIPLLVVSKDCYALIIASFVLFRFFDILKPLGIRAIDNCKGAFFVMADDIVAGIYSLIIVIILAQWVI